MWLSKRPNVTAGRARAWYTHITAEAVKRKLRRFTGKVSEAAAAESDGQLMLEHFKRIQTTLTALVEKHRTEQLSAPEAFITTLVEFEHVHIVTRAENYAAMRAKGNYREAGILLIPWKIFPRNGVLICGRKCFVERWQTPMLSAVSSPRCPTRQ